ncbi:MFS transporter [Streptacidiphilus sp. EB129]|uniref:MFS transporter n=1 Tax=Streptacidiphilus sp. EB129 TaxID=3156262 RepID=UPI00351105EB
MVTETLPAAVSTRRSRTLLFLLYFLFGSLAEGCQGIVLLWLVYDLSHNAFLVSVMVMLGYLPAAVIGLLFKRIADRGRADRIARSTNLTLACTSTVLGVQQLAAGHAVALVLTVIGVVQVVLSLAKMLNKAALNRLIRLAFADQDAAQLLKTSSSVSLIGQVAGAGLAGLVLTQGWIAAGLLCAAVAYAASAGSLALGTRGAEAAECAARDGAGVGDYRDEGDGRLAAGTAVRVAGGAEPERAVRGGAVGKIRWSSALVSVLVFSVPSSGALQFIAILLVPLSRQVAPDQPSYYAILGIVAIGGSITASLLLSANLVTAGQVMGWALPATAALALLLATLPSRYPAGLLSFLITVTITAHVICMQVLTNQLPRPQEIGQFAVARNVVASLAKASFSLAAGTLIEVFGLSTASVVLAGVLAAFWIGWLLFGQSLRAPAVGTA